VMIALFKTVFVQYVAVAITAKPVDNCSSWCDMMGV
jgi:hypothetical protein